MFPLVIMLYWYTIHVGCKGVKKCIQSKAIGANHALACWVLLCQPFIHLTEVKFKPRFSFMNCTVSSRSCHVHFTHSALVAHTSWCTYDLRQYCVYRWRCAIYNYFERGSKENCTLNLQSPICLCDKIYLKHTHFGSFFILLMP